MSRILGAVGLGDNIPHLQATQGALDGVLNTIYGLAGALAVIFIIIGGIRYILAAGNSAQLTQAKNTILYSIVGLIIVILAFSITNFVIGKLDVTSFASIRDSIINTLLYVAGSLAVVMIVYGAFRYVSSNGNTANITAAKNTILYAVIGLIITILAFAIVNFVIGTI